MKKDEIRENLREIIKKIKSTYNVMPKKKIIAAILVASCIISVGGKSCSSKKDESVTTMLVDVDDEARLVDKDGIEIVLEKNHGNLLAVISGEKFKNGNLYDAALVDKNGNIYKGMLDGKYITDDALRDALDTKETTKDILSDGDVNIVDAYNGMWIREEKKEDHNTENAKKLDNGTQVLSSSVSETSKYVSAHTWKESISVDRKNKSLYTGYIADTYLMNSNYDKAEGKRFIVKSKDVPLKLRSAHEINNNNIIGELNDNTEVLLVPNISSYSDESRDWFYVAIKNNDGTITFGWCCAREYDNEEKEIRYLVEKETLKEEPETEKEDNVEMIVDTKKDNYQDLKLRSGQSIIHGVLATIEDGTIIYTTSSSLKEADKMEEIDGHKWLKVRLISGQEGYVAADFVKENKVSEKENDQTEDNITTKNSDENVIKVDIDIDGNNETKEELEGVIGVDFDPRRVSDINDLEQLLTNENYYEGYEGKITNTQKPSFAYIRLGGSDCGRSGYGPSTKIHTSDPDILRACVELCNTYKIPFGYYYYSQATTKEEAEDEAKWINQTLDKLGNYYYNVLPFTIDVEDRWLDGSTEKSTRVKENSYNAYKKKHNIYNEISENQTSITNYVMDMVRDDNGIEVILYTDNNTLSSGDCSGFTKKDAKYPSTIDYSELADDNKENPWVVYTSSTHSENLSNNHTDISKAAKIRQIAIDKTEYPVNIDINFMDADYYNDLTKSLK